MRYFKVRTNVDEIKSNMPDLYEQGIGLLSSEEDPHTTFFASDEDKIIESMMHYPGFEEMEENPYKIIDEQNRITDGNMETFRSE